MAAVVADVPADHISAGLLAGASIRGGAEFTDVLPGVFYPVVIDAAGNVTINTSPNHPSGLRFHNSATATPDMVIVTPSAGVMVIGPDVTSGGSIILEVLDRRTTGGTENGLGIYTAAPNGVTLLEVVAGVGNIFYKNGAFFGATVDTTGRITAASLQVTGNVGFYGGVPTTKPTVTGSRGANAALASLLTALAGLGLIVDSST
jgi:hypothetical protein